MLNKISNIIRTAASKISTHFDHPKRMGAEALRKNGYVEYNQFKEDILDQMGKGKVSGYFCITCSFYEKRPDALKKGYCTALKAEDAYYGCCDIWKYDPHKVKEIMKD